MVIWKFLMLNKALQMSTVFWTFKAIVQYLDGFQKTIQIINVIYFFALWHFHDN